MNKSRNIGLAFSLCLLTQPLSAADFPTRMATMGNVDPDIVDSLNARCNSTDGGETPELRIHDSQYRSPVAADEIASSIEAFFTQASQRGDSGESVAKLFSPDGLCSGGFLDKVDMKARGLSIHTGNSWPMFAAPGQTRTMLADSWHWNQRSAAEPAWCGVRREEPVSRVLHPASGLYRANLREAARSMTSWN